MVFTKKKMIKLNEKMRNYFYAKTNFVLSLKLSEIKEQLVFNYNPAHKNWKSGS